MNPLDITINNTKRNPHREFQMEREERKKGKRGGGNDSDSDRGDEQSLRDYPILDLEGQSL